MNRTLTTMSLIIAAGVALSACQSTTPAAAETVTPAATEAPEVIRDEAADLVSFEEAINAADIAALESLLAEGADKNLKNVKGATPLSLAARVNCAECITVLLDAGADPTFGDTSFPTKRPIHWAADTGSIDALKALIEGGVPVDSTDGAGGHALLWAAFKGQTEAAEYLLSVGSDPTIVDGSKLDASGRAAGQGHDELAALLAAANESWIAEHGE